jgi:hypothetical protein
MTATNDRMTMLGRNTRSSPKMPMIPEMTAQTRAASANPFWSLVHGRGSAQSITAKQKNMAISNGMAPSR